MKLKISNSLSLPLDFVTQTQAILARKGAGKTNTAVVQAEELLKAGQQVVTIDPTGAWWGLKSSADGKSAGFPVVIFGGEHADAPLEEAAGELIATAIVEQRYSAIIDLSLLRKGQMHRFMAAFLETLYRLNREAMHLVIDEADTLAPQKPFGEEARTLGAMQDIVRRGRIRGIGCTLITQRPQVLNKDVLTQCEVLCTMRLTHPKDIGAIKEWIAVHGDERLAKDMIASLPALPVGTAWFWSPGWGDIFQRVMVRERETFDSSATPKAGEAKRAPKVIAPVDLQKLGQQIAATVQRQKENDPKALKKRIAELEKQQTVVRVDDSAVEKAVTRALAQRDREHEQDKAGLVSTVTKLQNTLVSIGRQVAEFADIKLPQTTQRALQFKPATTPVRREPPKARVVTQSNGEPLPKGEQTILIAIAQYPDGAQRDQLTVLTGYKRSTRDAYIQRLRERGYVEQQGESLIANSAGIEALGDNYEPLPTGDELRDYWLDKLPEGERKILEVLIGAYPNTVQRDDLSEKTGYKRSTRDAYLQRMDSKRLVESQGRGEVKASDELFD